MNSISAAKRRLPTSVPTGFARLDGNRLHVGVCKEGLRELAEQNLAKAHYLASKLPVAFDGPFFNEFVVHTGSKSPDEINSALLKQNIVGGLPAGPFLSRAEQ